MCSRYRAFIFLLTFLLYASFHLSRKPISIVKVRDHTRGSSGNLPEDWGLREPESRRMRAGRLLETAYSSIFLLGSFAVACFIFFFQKLNSLQCFMLYPLRGTSLSNYSSRIPKLN